MFVPSLPMLAAQADGVFVGKVTAFEAKLVPGELGKDDSRQMQVATVEVSGSILGKAAKKVQVGFIPNRRYRPAVAVGDEYLFLVRKHPTKKDTWCVEQFFN